MLNGLEVSIVPISTVVANTTTVRIDSEYYKRRHIADENLICRNRRVFLSPADLGLRVDASAFYPSIKAYYGKGELPFYRVADVDGIIDAKSSVRIPTELCRRYKTIKTAQEGDILFTKGGAIDRTGYVTCHGAVSRDLIVLNTSRLPLSFRLFLFSYFRTAFFRRLLLRSSSQTTQPHLTITLVRDLPCFVGSAQLRTAIAERVKTALNTISVGARRLRAAEQLFVSTLSLSGWTSPNPLTYTARSSEIKAARRMDAQYFSPKYESIFDHLSCCGYQVPKIQEIRSFNARGLQPEYNADGDVYVVNSRHILDYRINYSNLEKTTTAWAGRNSRAKIYAGDILTYTTGAKIGRTAHFDVDISAVASNHVNILRLTEGDPAYVAFVLNSFVGRTQTERHLSGSAQPELYPSNIDDFSIPLVSEDVQSEITANVRQSHELVSRTFQLLECATSAVDAAIKEGERAAFSILDAFHTSS